jgi:hypothetical protein
VPPSIQSQLRKPSTILQSEMLWSVIEVFFYVVATYIDQLELARLFIEKYTSEKQDLQLREYLGNSKDGIIVFKRPE